MVLLLARSVPNAQLERFFLLASGPWVIYSNHFFEERGIDCRLLTLVELALRKSDGDRGLADTRYEMLVRPQS